tara:strand:- start:6 stop:326 length:321 start_codon:yes stop_codon:yes gene_type:complete
MRLISIRLRDTSNPVIVGDKKAVFSFLNKKAVEFRAKKFVSVDEFDEKTRLMWEHKHNLSLFYKWCSSSITHNTDSVGNIKQFNYIYHHNKHGWSISCQEVDIGEL